MSNCTIGRGLAVTLVAAGLALAPAGSASADLKLPDYCKTAAADATVVLGKSPGSSVTATSVSYPKPGSLCFRYVVDVKTGPKQQVNLYARYADAQTGWLDPWTIEPLPLSQPDCDNYRQSVTVYRRSAFATKFTTVARATFKGSWHTATFARGVGWIGDHCQLGTPSGDTLAKLQNHTSGSFGATTFRIAVSAKVGSSFKKVSVTASTPALPPN